MTKLERIIVNSAPVRFLISKSKKIILPGFEGLHLYDVVIFFISQVKKVGLNERAAAISFNLLMAIPSGTIFLCTLIPYLPVSKQVTEELLILTRDLTPNENTYQLVKGFLDDFLQTERSGLLSIGFVLAIFYTSNAMIGLMDSFNRSLIYSTQRSFLQERWMAIRLTTVVVLLLIATVTLLVTQGALLKLLQEWVDLKGAFINWIIRHFRWVIIIPLFFYSVAIIYKYAPAIHKRWKLSSPGAILATFLIIITTFLFSYWVNNFGSYNKVYGSIGTILILMLVIYINSLMLLIGYELNVSIHSLKAMAEEREKAEREAESASANK